MQRRPTFDDYTFLNRWGLTFLGVWRDEGKADRLLRNCLHNFHVLILFGLMTLLLVPQWLDIYVLWGNIDANTETLVLVVFTICAMNKLYCLLSARHIFKDLISTMEENWKETMSETGPEAAKHRDILLDMASKARVYTIRYGFLMYSTASMYFVSPFMGMQQDHVRARKYPFFGWYYFDRFSDFYYGLCYLSQLMAGVSVGTSNYSADSIFLVAIYHSCAQLRIIQHDLKKLGGESDASTSPGRVTDLIGKHQKEIRTARKLAALFTGSSFQQLLVSCAIICIIGFKIIITLDQGGFQVLVYVAFMFVALLQIFLYCRPGDELITQSTAVGYAVYQSRWYALDVPTKRKVNMMILRSQRPLKMTAGSFYVLSLPNFTKILKTSMSFLSLFKAIY
ncbi:odorant receptor 9a-like isoform X2 [Phymastichus coffea]|uniref:odorant receptor 9a-like isoform X2 n=1 Tax=Phymastichus coffea TaxID=108790 RepID=UPI00273C077A|nr:odorant receptor 9a-like isoform X2 [Phymastichus coffea]